jgi:hypothetical protein
MMAELMHLSEYKISNLGLFTAERVIVFDQRFRNGKGCTRDNAV